MTARTLTLTIPAKTAPITIVRNKPTYAHLEVPSSKSENPAYDVVLTADFGRCTCKGFVFRGTCRHVTEARQATSA